MEQVYPWSLVAEGDESSGEAKLIITVTYGSYFINAPANTLD